MFKSVMTETDLDVLIIGAGLSGIGAACHLQEKCPGKTYAILEGRGAIGGTWDLFRYPGIRSDSDMYTLGYNFKPWTGEKSIADGPSILDYIRETATENGIDQHIRFNHLVRKASWDSATASWTVEASDSQTDEIRRLTCRFLYMCAGYYSYEGGYRPDFPDEGIFKGEIVHPQDWPEGLDYKDRKVVVIGSGATAVTLVPEMAKKAAHVVMLQRSPTYILSRPSEDEAARTLQRRLPARLAYSLVRWRNVLVQMFFFNLARKRPDSMKQRLVGAVRKSLGPEHDVEKHFTPRYNPWDQRLCLVPDGDLFKALREGTASVVTDQVSAFTEHGIRLQSGEEIEADIIVTATGLQLAFLGDIDIDVDGKPVEPSSLHVYRGLMFEGVPNLVSIFGYTNASWTLKADLSADFVVRLIRYMDRHGYDEVRPQADGVLEDEPWLDFSSGYISRAAGRLPKQGHRPPWRLHQNYVKDIFLLRHANLEDGVLKFRTGQEHATQTGAPEAAGAAAQ